MRKPGHVGPGPENARGAEEAVPRLRYRCDVARGGRDAEPGISGSANIFQKRALRLRGPGPAVRQAIQIVWKPLHANMKQATPVRSLESWR